MSVITGRAKKYDGTAIDYVSIFNWTNGTCIAQVIPDAAGNWEYEYFTNLKVGITYVADGCEPITHGAYDFIHQATIPGDTILHYDFNGDLLDKSTNALNGVNTGSAIFVAGRKAGSKALNFSRSLTVKTPNALPINSNKISISFWFRTNYSQTMYLMATIENGSITNGLAIDANNAASGAMYLSGYSNGNRNSAGISGVFDNTWHHAICIIDRSGATNREISKLYIDGVLAPLVAGFDSVLDGNFDNSVLMIGENQYYQSLGIQNKYVGDMQDLRIYNRIITADERDALFNE